MPCVADCEQCERMRRTREYIEAHRARRGELQRHAREVLARILDDTNRKSLEKDNRVHVTGSHGGRYVVTVGYSGNVYRLDAQGKYGESLCAHPEMVLNGALELPVEVAMATQILALQTDEPGFLAVAN